MPKAPILALVALVALLVVTGSAALADTRRVLTGELTYRPRIALPETAEALIEIRDPTDAVVAEVRIPTGGRQVPVPFAIEAPAGPVLRLRAGFTAGAGILWISPELRIAPDGADALGAVGLAPFQPMGFAAGYRCGNRLIRVGLAGDRMVMDTGAGRVLLDPAPAASGARYVAGDGTAFWDRGGVARVTLAGVDLPECRLSFPALADSFVAGGVEPFWRATVAGGALALDRMGLDPLSLPVTDSRMTDAGDILIVAADPARALRAVMTRRDAICRDPMTGLPHPESVDLAMGDHLLQGCGGDPADLLVGRTWRVEDIGGAGILADSRIAFALDREGRISGTGGCNRFFGSYALTGEGLSLGPQGMTMMACPGALMDQERRVMAALERVDRFDIDPTGALRLIGADAPLLTARAEGTSAP